MQRAALSLGCATGVRKRVRQRSVACDEGSERERDAQYKHEWETDLPEERAGERLDNL